MKIIVFVKQVPDAEQVKLDPATGNLMRQGVSSIMNPNDANAIEAAMALKRKYGGTVSAVSMGPPQAAEVLKKALSLGCDEAYLLSDRAFGGADTLATSYTLAKAAEKIGFDLLVFGRNASDGDTAQTGPATAAWLDIPQITLAHSLDIQDSWLVCQRERETHIEMAAARLPALVTVCREANTPKLPTLMDIMKASSKPLTVWTAEDLQADVNCTGVSGSPSSTGKVFAPEKAGKATVYLTGTPAEMAAQMADVLEEKHFI